MDEVTLAKWQYPKKLLPDFHVAIYQLIVGAEQGHSDKNMKAYAANLRKLAAKAFVDGGIID